MTNLIWIWIPLKLQGKHNIHQITFTNPKFYCRKFSIELNDHEKLASTLELNLIDVRFKTHHDTLIFFFFGYCFLNFSAIFFCIQNYSKRFILFQSKIFKIVLKLNLGEGIHNWFCLVGFSWLNLKIPYSVTLFSLFLPLTWYLCSQDLKITWQVQQEE